MDLKQRLQDDIVVAMKAGDVERRNALRLLTAAIKQVEVDSGAVLSDADVLDVLLKQAKQRRESIADYEKAGRDDLAEQELQELHYIEAYLPRQMSEEEYPCRRSGRDRRHGRAGHARHGAGDGALDGGAEGTGGRPRDQQNRAQPAANVETPAAASRPRPGPMATQPESTNAAGSDRRRTLINQSLLWTFAVVTTLGLTAVLSIDLLFGSAGDLTVGETAPEAIFAPRDATFESAVLTQRVRQEAADLVEPVYDSAALAEIGRSQSSLAREIFAFVTIVRADAYSNEAANIAYLQAIDALVIEEQVAVGLLSLSPLDYDLAQEDILRIIQDVMREPIRLEQVSRARLTARRSASFDLAPAQEAVVTSLAPQFVVANTFLDEQATTAARQAAADAVGPQQQRVFEGQLIVAAGQSVNAETVEILRELGLIQSADRRLAQLGSNLLAALVAAALLALFWEQFRTGQRELARHLVILALSFLLFVLGAKLLAPAGGNWSFLFPAASLSMLVMAIFNTRMAVMVTMLLAGLFGYVTNASLELTTYAAVGGLFAVLGLRENTDRVNPIFRAGILAAVGYAVTLLVFRLPQEMAPLDLALLGLFALLNGVISASITLAGFFLIGSGFGVITTVQLQELSRMDHPLLKELLHKAPGTYHHSIMVANLAEQAAERIRANGTLVRVGAFYHDVGKVRRPTFFSENQDGENPHDTMAPDKSARIVINHVSEGLELARKHRLPLRIRDFIAEHHGDRVVWGFYMKARELAGDAAEEVDVAAFRHAGPRPQSRETGIVMLADATEATSSAVRPSTEAGIEKLVDKIVDDHIAEGQLDNSGLTLGDINAIKTSFIETLKGRFHVRVRYRGNEELVEADEAAGAPPVATAPTAPPAPAESTSGAAVPDAPAAGAVAGATNGAGDAAPAAAPPAATPSSDLDEKDVATAPAAAPLPAPTEETA